MVNHFQKHYVLSNKSNLFLNLLSYAEFNKENVFNLMPITFYIDIKNFLVQENRSLHKFVKFFKKLEESKNCIPENKPKSFKKFLDKIGGKPKKIYAKYAMPNSHFEGHNLWVLKPSCLNRGRGVHIFKDLNFLKQKIQEYSQEPEMGASLIVQKYIEKPLLINGRKFDIRMWVLITHNIECYIFKEGYLRTSSMIYKIDNINIDNKYMHLTNNAIQRYSDNYGSFEEGNQISFKNFNSYLHENYNESIEKILEQTKKLINKSYLAIKNKIIKDTNKMNCCFEIFGYDFIVDSEFNVWLIEVNTNPCLEESSSLLKILIPRMINDAFKLTIDVIFPPLTQYSIKPSPEVFSVPGYSDKENMW